MHFIFVSYCAFDWNTFLFDCETLLLITLTIFSYALSDRACWVYCGHKSKKWNWSLTFILMLIFGPALGSIVVWCMLALVLEGACSRQAIVRSHRSSDNYRLLKHTRNKTQLLINFLARLASFTHFNYELTQKTARSMTDRNEQGYNHFCTKRSTNYRINYFWPSS